MANVFTDLICDIYCALDTVSREQIGLIPAVTLDACGVRAAVGQTVRSFVAPPVVADNITPGQQGPNQSFQTIGNRTITINKARTVSWIWEGEEMRALDACGAGSNNIFQKQVEQAMRTLTNEMEADLAALWPQAQRVVVPSGSTLFDANNYRDMANVHGALLEAGAPPNDLQLVLSNRAAAALRGNAQYTGCDTACSDTILRQGVLLDQFGMSIRQSAQIASGVVSGTGASATTNAAGYAVGATVITLASAGTGTVVVGDTIQFAGDPHSYVVVAGDADVSNGGTITIGGGLLQAIPASATNITLVDDAGEKNMAFPRSAIVLLARAPATPPMCNDNIDFTLVTDPRSGLTFEVARFCEYRRVRFEVAAVWGVGVMKPEHLVLLVD
jgi:hypothetical protein